MELAQHEYLLPRLRGQWEHLERLEGAIGARGPGETQLETDRRLIGARIARAKRQIEAVRGQRALHRRRRRSAGIPVVALVGYTNAGKSSLMQALAGAEVFVADALFATLDPLTRRITAAGAEDGDATFLLTDTVGFIQKLPAQLVSAFRATLEELDSADLLLHVVDVATPAAEAQAAVVLETLDGLGLSALPVLTVLNKVDAMALPDGTAVQCEADIAALELSDPAFGDVGRGAGIRAPRLGHRRAARPHRPPAGREAGAGSGALVRAHGPARYRSRSSQRASPKRGRSAASAARDTAWPPPATRRAAAASPPSARGRSSSQLAMRPPVPSRQPPGAATRGRVRPILQHARQPRQGASRLAGRDHGLPGPRPREWRQRLHRGASAHVERSHDALQGVVREARRHRRELLVAAQRILQRLSVAHAPACLQGATAGALQRSLQVLQREQRELRRRIVITGRLVQRAVAE